MSNTHEVAPEVAGAVDTEGRLRAFTFRLDDALHAIEVRRVLAINQLRGELIHVPSSATGYRGLTLYQGTPTPVIDLAEVLGVSSRVKARDALLALLEECEEGHLVWIKALETALEDGSRFRGEPDPRRCKFGRWLYSFSSSDSDLVQAVRQFERPHREVHALAHSLLALAEKDRKEALTRLALARRSRLVVLQGTFARVKARIAESSRSVCVFTTDDGVRPHVGLNVEGIEDLRDFPGRDFVPRSRSGIPAEGRHRYVKGFLRGAGDQEDALLLDVDEIGHALGGAEVRSEA